MLEARCRTGYASVMSGFHRHIAACNTAVLPGGRAPLWLGGERIGWLAPATAAMLADQPGVARDATGLHLAGADVLARCGRALAAAGLTRWRDEAFDVRAAWDGPVLGQIDRGALPALGLISQGVHVNGLVRRADGMHLWVARRSPDKLMDPGKLDHIVAGGIPAGLSALQTVVKEAGEEAAIPADLAARAVFVGRVAYNMERPEGLRRDVLSCYDLDLPESFQPHPHDGEVHSFELWPITRAVAAVRDGADFKFNVNLVLIDLFLRLGLIAGAAAAGLRAALG